MKLFWLLATVLLVVVAAAALTQRHAEPASFAIFQTAKTHVGVVATRGVAPATSGAGGYLMSRTGHIFRASVTSFQLVYACFAGSPETALGADCTITAGVEFPVGTFAQQVMFGGSPTGTIINGSYIVSDPISVPVANGATIRARQWMHNTSALPISSGTWTNFTNFGDTTDCSASAQMDRTTDTSTPSFNCSGDVYYPVAIIGAITKPSPCFLGDSIASGQNDTSDSSGDVGIVARSLGPNFGWSAFSVPGTSAANWNSGHTARAAIINAYCTDIISELGINDLPTQTAAGTLALLQTVWGTFPGKRVYQTTITPAATSTNNFTDCCANQTDLESGKNAALNVLLFASPAGLTSVFDVAASIANGSTSTASPELWLTNGTPGYCVATASPSFGVHPTQACYLLIQASGAIPSHFP
jgi:hypothetical protein